jgi:hypothetical protein
MGSLAPSPMSVAAPDRLSSLGTRPMTVEAMQAAVVAIRAGVFDRVNSAHAWGGEDTREAAVLPLTPRRSGASTPWAPVDVGGPVVVVLPGHAGAGASTVALAVAEGLAEGRSVHLVEYAEPARSGLLAASSIELGAGDDGWRRGRRGRLEVFRLARRPVDGGLPPPPETFHAGRLLVVDAGGPLTAAILDSPGDVTGGELLVVATRLTVPAIRQTEQVLAAIAGDAVVAAVGPARWPRVVEASCGAQLADLRGRGRVVPVPVDRRLESSGLTGDRLPTPVAEAGRALAALLVSAEPPRRRRRTTFGRGTAEETR